MGYCTRTFKVSPTPPQLFLCFLGSLTFSGICTRKQGKTRQRTISSTWTIKSVLTSISAFPANFRNMHRKIAELERSARHNRWSKDNARMDNSWILCWYWPISWFLFWRWRSGWNLLRFKMTCGPDLPAPFIQYPGDRHHCQSEKSEQARSPTNTQSFVHC